MARKRRDEIKPQLSSPADAIPLIRDVALSAVPLSRPDLRAVAALARALAADAGSGQGVGQDAKPRSAARLAGQAGHADELHGGCHLRRTGELAVNDSPHHSSAVIALGWSNGALANMIADNLNPGRGCDAEA